MKSMEKFEKIRKEYPGLEYQAYLDTSTTGLISKKSYEAMRKYLDQRHFTGVTLSEYWANWAYADKVRESLAEMINADEKEVFYGKDCSDLINIFVSKVDIPANANVVIPDISFPWVQVANTTFNQRRPACGYPTPLLGRI